MASPSPSFPPVRACLFDMDGLLINSEDIYTKVTNIMLERNGKPPLPWNIKAQMQGRPFPEATQILKDWAQLDLSQEAYGKEVSELQRELFPTSTPLPGTDALLKTLQAAGVELALATSSQSRNFHIKTDHLQDFMSVFTQEHRVVGDDPRIGKGRGKPLPDIYLLALETINGKLRKEGKPEIKVEECLVFEDSVPGVESGRRAGMRVVWCPHPELLKEYHGQEPAVLAGLTSGGKERAAVDAETPSLEGKVFVGWPSQVGDGWADLLHTLEDFDYKKYGIRVPAKV